jgi:hypothetical protein
MHPTLCTFTTRCSQNRFDVEHVFLLCAASAVVVENETPHTIFDHAELPRENRILRWVFFICLAYAFLRKNTSYLLHF